MKTTPIMVVAAAVLAAVSSPAKEFEHMSIDARPSHNGTYVVSAEPDTRNAWSIRVRTSNGHVVENARVYAYARMPEAGRANAQHLRAVEIGDGEYRINDLDLDRSGWWNVGVIITHEAMDSVAFNVTVR